MLKHSDGQPGNFKVYREYHEKLRRADGWYCFVVYRPHRRSGCTSVKDKMARSVSRCSAGTAGKTIAEPSRQKSLSIRFSNTPFSSTYYLITNTVAFKVDVVELDIGLEGTTSTTYLSSPFTSCVVASIMVLHGALCQQPTV